MHIKRNGFLHFEFLEAMLILNSFNNLRPMNLSNVYFCSHNFWKCSIHSWIVRFVSRNVGARANQWQAFCCCCLYFKLCFSAIRWFPLTVATTENVSTYTKFRERAKEEYTNSAAVNLMYISACVFCLSVELNKISKPVSQGIYELLPLHT